jgi:hypothetical protein
MAISELDKFTKVALARKFSEAFQGTGEISKESFDIFIIDNGLAEDPGTDDSTSLAHKGFVQARNNARRALNTWAKGLPPEEHFAVEISRQSPEALNVVRWEDHARATALDIGNRVEMFSRNKLSGVKKIRRLLLDKAGDSSDDRLDELYQMIGLVEAHGIKMHRQVSAEVNRFNVACLSVEEKARELLKQIGYQEAV